MLQIVSLILSWALCTLGFAFPQTLGDLHPNVIQLRDLSFLPLLREPRLLGKLLEGSSQFLPSSQEWEMCVIRMQYMVNHLFTDKAAINFVAYSGKALNELGDYRSCSENSDVSYYLEVGLSLSAFAQLRLPLCLPKECSAEVVQWTRPLVADFLSRQLNMTFKTEAIHMTDIKRLNHALNQIRPGCLIFVVATAVLLVTILLASVLDYQGILTLRDRPLALWQRLLLCFSLQRNIGAVFNSQNRIDQKLEVLNGLRLLAMYWVILGHSFIFVSVDATFNLPDLFSDIVSRGIFALVKSGTYAVDVFFWLSGFLAALGFYRGFSRPSNRTVKTVLMAYIHRYLRLLPLYGFIILYTIYIQPVLYDLPNNPITTPFRQRCESQWYLDLLYINNFVNKLGEMCVSWTWYLMIDMQIFLVMPFVMLIYAKSKRAGLLTIAALGLMSIVVLCSLAWHYELNESIVKPSTKGDAENLYYGRPYCRLVPYLLGVLVFLLYEEGKHAIALATAIKDSVCRRAWLRYTCYLCGCGFMGLPMLSYYYLDKYANDWGVNFGAAQLVFSRPLFTLGLSLVIYPVLVGRGKPLLGVLGYFLFNPIGKLTYGAYLLHIPVLSLVLLSRSEGAYYSAINVMFKSAQISFLSYTLSFIVTLLYESPVVQLLKTFLEPASRASLAKQDAS